MLKRHVYVCLKVTRTNSNTQTKTVKSYDVPLLFGDANNRSQVRKITIKDITKAIFLLKTEIKSSRRDDGKRKGNI